MVMEKSNENNNLRISNRQRRNLHRTDEMKEFIETAQKLVDAWDADPDNYSQLEEGLTALKAALEK